MKNLFLVYLALGGLLSCSPNVQKQINQTKTAYGDRCEGFSGLSWQEQIQGADAETTARLVSELTAAAEADVKQSEDLKGSANADVTIESELAKVINQNVTQKSKVSQEFWEAENRFGESICLFLYLLDDPRLSKETKKEIIDDIRKLVVSHNDFVLNKKKVHE